MKREEIIEHSLKLLRSLEGLKLRAYWDVSRWSIGMGTISYEGEVITEAEAYKRSKAYVESVYDYLKRNKYNLLESPFCVAMISKMYQYGNGILRYYNGRSLQDQINEHLNDTQYNDRRVKEINYYNSIAKKEEGGNFIFAFFIIALLLIIKKMIS